MVQPLQNKRKIREQVIKRSHVFCRGVVVNKTIQISALQKNRIFYEIYKMLYIPLGGGGVLPFCPSFEGGTGGVYKVLQISKKSYYSYLPKSLTPSPWPVFRYGEKEQIQAPDPEQGQYGVEDHVEQEDLQPGLWGPGEDGAIFRVIQEVLERLHPGSINGEN